MKVYDIAFYGTSGALNEQYLIKADHCVEARAKFLSFMKNTNNWKENEHYSEAVELKFVDGVRNSSIYRQTIC